MIRKGGTIRNITLYVLISWGEYEALKMSKVQSLIDDGRGDNGWRSIIIRISLNGWSVELLVTYRFSTKHPF